ncbi:MAG TPA: DUF371 domain-containing protein [Methanomicrobiales archaeon]|jgi:hypothetical protein|nr:DUF371 domain-containing protein [Methanomicrobiales archaeon]
MEVKERIHCRGHPLVSGTHPTTFEVTAEDHLTRKGDCIIGIRADKGAAGLSSEFRRVVADDHAILTTRLTAGGHAVEVHGKGSSRMTLTHPTDLVWRRSSFVCPRTVAIHCDRVAITLPRDLIRTLAEGAELEVVMVALAEEDAAPKVDDT